MGEMIYTIGHSNHPIETFLRMLQAFQIETLVDVRRYPGSRKNPQYNQENLRDCLQEHHISYLHMEVLGGRRPTSPGSVNTAWQSPSFRGYADYMQTPEFEMALAGLIRIASESRTAILCAEAVPWRCHRALIADALLAHGLEVVDILGEKSSRPHQLPAWARVEQGMVTYPKIED